MLLLLLTPVIVGVQLQVLDALDLPHAGPSKAPMRLKPLHACRDVEWVQHRCMWPEAPCRALSRRS